MKVRLVHEFRFEAAHRLPKVPPGHQCANLHGHSYRIEIAVRGEMDPDLGWLIDFQVLQDLWKPISKQLDHRYLNDLAGLENPTSEVLARWIWERLAPDLHAMLERVTVYETFDARCEYEGD